MGILQIERDGETHIVKWNPDNTYSRADALDSLVQLRGCGVLGQDELTEILLRFFRPTDWTLTIQKVVGQVMEDCARG